MQENKSKSESRKMGQREVNAELGIPTQKTERAERTNTSPLSFFLIVFPLLSFQAIHGFGR